MARFIQTVSAADPASFVTAVNAVLAALTNPTIRQWAMTVTEFDRRLGVEYRLALSYTDGGAALATPFLLRIDESHNLDTADTALQAFLTANAAYFVTGARMFYQDAGPKIARYTLATLYNVTGGASANYAAL